MNFLFFQFQRTEKMDSVMKGQMEAIPPTIFGLELPLARLVQYTVMEIILESLIITSQCQLRTLALSATLLSFQ